MSRLALALGILAVVGCGNSSPGGGGSGGTGGGGGSGGSGGNGSQPDLATPTDLANAFMCGSNICMGSQQCCVTGMTPTCASSCADGGFQAQCQKPANCGGNPCCINVGSGFTVQSVVCTTSASACPPMINGSTQSGMDRACTVDADCVSGLPSMPAPQLPDCCTNTQTMQHVCFNKSYLQLPGITGWTCP